MTKIFLIGGGWDARNIFQTLTGDFSQAATRNGEKRIAIVVAEETGADSHAQFLRFFGAFESIGLNSVEASEDNCFGGKFFIERNLRRNKTDGRFVCGGLTPAYFDALCVDKNWLAYLTENEIPYGGFSAGESVASEKSIIGGWQRGWKINSCRSQTKMRAKIRICSKGERFGFGRFCGWCSRNAMGNFIAACSHDWRGICGRRLGDWQKHDARNWLKKEFKFSVRAMLTGSGGKTTRSRLKFFNPHPDFSPAVFR